MSSLSRPALSLCETKAFSVAFVCKSSYLSLSAKNTNTNLFQKPGKEQRRAHLLKSGLAHVDSLDCLFRDVFNFYPVLIPQILSMVITLFVRNVDLAFRKMTQIANLWQNHLLNLNFFTPSNLSGWPKAPINGSCLMFNRSVRGSNLLRKWLQSLVLKWVWNSALPDESRTTQTELPSSPSWLFQQ